MINILQRGFLSILSVMIGAACVLVFQMAVAKSTCGDGVCSSEEHASDSCDADCGRNRGWCGNRVCELSENCKTCEDDCGSCSTGGWFGGDKADEADEEELLPVCGDGSCDLTEGCDTCADDCGMCPQDWTGMARYKMRRAMRLAQVYLRRGFVWAGRTMSLSEAVVTMQNRIEDINANARQRQEAAQELQAFLAEYDAIDERFSGVDQRLAAMVSGSDTVLNALPSMRVRSRLSGAVSEERRDLIGTTGQFLGTADLSQVLFETALTSMTTALANEDIEAVRKLLPKPKRSQQNLRDALGEYEMEFGSMLSDETSGIFRKAFAAGDEEGSASDEFERSIGLLQKMRMRASNPATEATTLEEDIAYLQNRGRTIAGVIGVAESDFLDKLETVKRDASSPKKKTVLDLLNMLRFIRSSENFQNFEESMQRGERQLRTGVDDVLKMNVAPIASAAEILEEELGKEKANILDQGGIDEQRDLLSEQILQQQARVTELLTDVPEERRHEFAVRMNAIGQALQGATTVEQIRSNLDGWLALLSDIQFSIRAERNFWYRTVYFLQDFFHFRS